MLETHGHYWRHDSMEYLRWRRYHFLAGMICTVMFIWFFIVGNITKTETILASTSTKLTSTLTVRCAAKTHLAFVKTHKTASSTVANIIQRFGLKHHLSFVLPKSPNNYLWIDQYAVFDRLLPHPNGSDQKFDLLYNHAIYNRLAISKLMHNNTVYITILRHPVNQFLSAFYFYRTIYKKDYLTRIPGPYPIEEFLKHPKRYEPKFNYESYTNNRMSLDLGIPIKVFDHPLLLESVIDRIDQEFTLVMIMEYFVESLVLLKRLLCWTMEDIIALRLNTVKKDQFHVTLKAGMFNDIKKWAHADVVLYEYFYRKFWRRISHMKEDFWREVESFKEIQLKVQNYCTNINVSQDFLIIPRSEWTEQFTVNSHSCTLLTMNEVKFTNYLRSLGKS